MIRPLALMLSSVAIASLAACATTPRPPVLPASSPAIAPPPESPAPVAPAAAPAPQAALPLYLDPTSAVFTQRSVFFGFDSFVIDSDEQAAVVTQGHYLADHPQLHVRLEGNTDERGDSEYNLALGQKRAEALQAALRVMGVRDDQLEAVSLGKEKPRATGHDEAAWKQNRRADVVYPSR